MRPNIVIRFFGLTIVFAALTGCPAKRPFRSVQLCLANVDEIPAFTSFMDEIAQEYRMEFTDRSGQTTDELRSLAADDKNVPTNERAINIGGYRNDFSFGAANMGLPTTQVVVGFNGSNLAVAKQFASTVVQKLSTRWKIYEVPENRGASTIPDCN